MIERPSVKIGAVLATGCGGYGLLHPLSLALIAIVACSGAVLAQETQRIPGQKPLQMGSVAGTVRDENGRAIAGVLLEFRQQRIAFAATTDGEGIYRLKTMKLRLVETASRRHRRCCLFDPRSCKSSTCSCKRQTRRPPSNQVPPEFLGPHARRPCLRAKNHLPIPYFAGQSLRPQPL